MPLTVVTGANRGIGLALAQHYAQAGHEIVGLCRSASAELNAAATQVIAGVELTDPNGIRTARQALAERQIDLLLNVAGVMRWESVDQFEAGSVLRQFEINALAPLALTAKLIDRLRPGSKVVFLTSRLGSISDNETGSGYGYRMSKAALNIAGERGRRVEENDALRGDGKHCLINPICDDEHVITQPFHSIPRDRINRWAGSGRGQGQSRRTRLKPQRLGFGCSLGR